MTDTAEMEPDLENERDDLREELVILSGQLKKLGFDFTDTVSLFQNDTEPATTAKNQRLKRRIDSMKKRLDIFSKETAPPPPPSTPTFQPLHRRRASRQQNDDDDGVAVKEVLPRYGFK